MRQRSTFRAVAVLACALLVVASCGDDDDEGAEGTTTTAGTEETTTTAPELTGDPIKLMTIYVAEGEGATPELGEGAQAAVAAVNRDGGIDGRPLELIECDAGADPNQAADCGRQAVDEGVVAVVGALTANSGEFLPILEEAGIPSVGTVPASAADFTSAAAWPLYGGLVTAAGGLAAGLAEKGATKISIVRIDLAAASAIKLFADQALANTSAVTVNDVAVPTGAPDMPTYVASALEGGTDAVVVGLFGQEATNFMAEMRQTNPDVMIAATTTEFDAVVDALGDAADGIVVTSFYDETSPEFEQFVTDLEEAGFEENTGFRRNSYASVMAVVSLLGQVDEITAEALTALLPTVSDLEAPMQPAVDFTEGGVGGIPRVFNPCVQYAELMDGEDQVFSDGFLNPFTGESC